MMNSLESIVDRLKHLEKLCHDASRKKRNIFIEYYFDEKEEESWLCASHLSGGVRLTDTDGSPLNEKKLTYLKTLHDLLFDKAAPSTTGRSSIEEILHWVFIKPVLDLTPADFYGYIFIFFNKNISRFGEQPVFNLSAIYELSFLYQDNNEISRLLFINISDSEPLRFLRKLFTSPLPFANQIDILYGFPINDGSEGGIFRERAFKEGITRATAQGARIYTIENIDQFESLFSNENKGRVVQMLTHFHDGMIFTPTWKFILVDDLKDAIDMLFRKEKLRNDICIHAVTCNNFSFFKILYDYGIKSIYYSSNDLLTNEIAATFWELYHGRNALKCGVQFPYLDGESFIFEAWARVTRCFYRNAFLNNKIEIS